MIFPRVFSSCEDARRAVHVCRMKVIEELHQYVAEQGWAQDPVLEPMRRERPQFTGRARKFMQRRDA